MTTHQNRINILDSFRALAALGVLWIHIWTTHQQPGIYIKNFNIITPINIIGNGVDLFFVISGFCMYYFYAKDSTLTKNYFWKFLIKRWMRLSPVFYFATFVYILAFSQSDSFSNFLKFLTSVFYLNSISSYNAEGFMWSLGTEWQFYFIIPILIFYQKKYGFNLTITSLSILFFLLCVISVLLFKSKSDLLTDQIIFRFFEFLWGIIIGKLLIENFKTKFNPNLLIIIFVVIAYVGRYLLTESILEKGGDYKNLIKIFAYNIMPLGFAGIIFICLTTSNFLKTLIDNVFFHLVGRISYSFYLWHGLVHIAIGNILITNFGNFSNLVLAISNFILSVVILIPISYASYKIFELKASQLLQKK